MTLEDVHQHPVIAAVLARFDQLDAMTATRLGGAINETYRLTNGGGDTFILKLYRPGWRTLDDVAAEVSSVHFLVEGGVKAATPVTDRHGNLAGVVHTSEGERCFVLSRAVPGETPRLESEAARLFGRVVGRLHEVGAKLSSTPTRRPLDLDHLLGESVHALEHALSQRPEDLRYLRRLAGRLHARLAASAPELAWSFCHGDLHGGNARRSGDDIWLLDFEFCGPGFVAYDIAVYRWVIKIHAPDREASLWQHFCDGYRDGRDLSALDLDAVPLFVLARHLWDLAVEARLATETSTKLFEPDELDRYLAFFRAWEAQLPYRCWIKQSGQAPPSRWTCN